MLSSIDTVWRVARACAVCSRVAAWRWAKRHALRASDACGRRASHGRTARPASEVGMVKLLTVWYS